MVNESITIQSTDNKFLSDLIDWLNKQPVKPDSTVITTGKVEKLQKALKPYAYRDNWRSHNQSSGFLTWFDPEYLAIPSRKVSGMETGGWELAEEALKW